jgi:hypothetical protein
VRGLKVDLDGQLSSHEVDGVGWNTAGMAAAWACGRTSVARVTSASRAPRLAWLGLRASHGEAKLITAVVIPLPSRIH